MGLLDWLRSSDNPDAIETLLKNLAQQTSRLEGKQHRVAARRDSVTLMISLHGTLAYLAYLVLLYFDVLPDHIHPFVPPHWLVLVAWPPLIFGLRQLVAKLFNHRLRSISHQLDALHKRQNAEIEKLKKQTRYDETRALLERLGESPNPNSPSPLPPSSVQAKGKTPRKSMPASLSTPQGTPVKGGAAQAGPAAYLGTPANAPNPQAGSLMSPASSARKGWADRFADVLLGENESTGGQDKYALICGKCFNHNGLVLKEDLPYTQYVCPKCGHFNPPKNLGSSRPANMLEVPAQLKSRQPQRGRASMPSSMSTPSFGSLVGAAGSGRVSPDSEEEKQQPEVKLAAKAAGEPHPSLRKRATGSALADDARRQAALPEVDSEDEQQEFHDS